MGPTQAAQRRRPDGPVASALPVSYDAPGGTGQRLGIGGSAELAADRPRHADADVAIARHGRLRSRTVPPGLVPAAASAGNRLGSMPAQPAASCPARNASDSKAQAGAWVWLVIYVAEPPLLLWAFIAQLGTAGAQPSRSNPLSRPYRALLAAQAAILLAFGAALFVAPADVGEAWPGS
jgi:hypothetical protein